MRYKYIDTEGNVIQDPSDNVLKKELSKNYKEWTIGSGDAAIESNITELIILKVEQGIFIMQLSDYTSPRIKPEEDAQVITHVVGGEPMDIPSVCLCDEEVAFEIIKYFIENEGGLYPEYQWMDIYSLIPDRYED